MAGLFPGTEIGTSLDKLYAARTRQVALQTRPSGVPSRWRNPSTGNAGAIMPTRTDRSADGIYCREYQRTVTSGERTGQAHGSACRQPDGAWRVSNQHRACPWRPARSSNGGDRFNCPCTDQPFRHIRFQYVTKSESLSRRRARADAEEGVPARFRIHAIPETDMHDPERYIRDIPLSQLELSPCNVRKTPADASAFTELKASIAAHGLLENLIARAMEPGTDCIARYAVIAGGRAPCRDAGAGRRGRAGRGPPRALPHDRKHRGGRRSFAGREHGPRRHAPGRSGRGIPPPGRCGQHGGRHRGALRGLGAHRGEAAAARQRRTDAARGLPRGRDRSGHIDGLRRHHGSCAPERGLGDGEPTGLPARHLADQAPADRGPGSGHLRHRAFRRHRGLRGGGRPDRPRPVRRGGRAGDLVRRSRSLEQARHGQPPGGGEGTGNALEMGRGAARRGLERHYRLWAGASATGRADRRGEGRDRTLEDPQRRTRQHGRRGLDRRAGRGSRVQRNAVG